MIQRTPNDLTWYELKEKPLPNPELIHPDTKIIVWDAAYVKDEFCLTVIRSLNGQWVCDDNCNSCSKQLADISCVERWAWWKSFA